MSEEHHHDDEANQNPSAISDTGKDIKKRMDRYHDNIMKSALGGEETPPPAGDSTKSEE